MAKNNKHTLVVDNGDTEDRYPFSCYENAKSAWKMCDNEIERYKAAAHMFSASVYDDVTGTRVLHVEYSDEE